MEIVHLPQDLFAGQQDEDLLFHYYASGSGPSKGKSVLHKNAISLVIQGEKTMYFAEKTIQIRDNTFHLLSTGYCVATVNFTLKGPFTSMMIFFDDQVLTHFYLKYQYRINGIKPKRKEPFLCFEKDAFILNYISSLTIFFQAGKTISKEMRLLKFEELMLYLLEKYPQEILSFYINKQQRPDEALFRKAVETNLFNNITLEELAFICNTSLSTFKRKFVQVYGMPPGKWILQKRMEMARVLLLHHGEKPGEIYHQLGYENHSSFSQSFRQTFGLTPKAFREQQLNVHR